MLLPRPTSHRRRDGCYTQKDGSKRKRGRCEVCLRRVLLRHHINSKLRPHLVARLIAGVR